MKTLLILATQNGLFTAGHEGDAWAVKKHSLEGRHITCAIARQGFIIAGTQDGLFRSADSGESWQAINNGLKIRHVRWLAYHPDIQDLEFAGTEPAGVFVSHDGGDSWQGRPEVAALREQHGWWLPYSPEDGCVRGFAIHGERAYAAVEVGGVLRSDDRGASWALAPGSDGDPAFREPPEGHIHADVHSIEVHPSSPDLVVAPTNAGLYRSRDGGKSWARINDDGYTRACWLDPEDPAHIISGPARSVGQGGTMLETRDAGASWHEITAGLDTPWPRAMVERFSQVGSQLFAVLSNGQVFAASLGTFHWQRVLPAVNGVNALTGMNE